MKAIVSFVFVSVTLPVIAWVASNPVSNVEAGLVSKAVVAQTVVDSRAPWGIVEGRVVDAGGLGQSGVEVVLQDHRGLGGLGQTDRNGDYRIEVKACHEIEGWTGRLGFPRTRAMPSKTRLVLSARSHERPFCSQVFVRGTRGASMRATDVVLYEGGFVRGVVEDRFQNPLRANIKVLASGAVGTSTFSCRVEPDDGGRFQVGPLPPGEVVLSVSNVHCGQMELSIDVEEGATVEKHVVLFMLPSLQGQVVDIEGNPMVGVEVACMAMTHQAPNGDALSDGSLRATEASLENRPRIRRSRAALSRRVQTDDRGQFSFFGLDETRRYSVGVAGLPIATPTSRQTALRPPCRDLELITPKRGALEASLIDARTRKPIADARVQWLPVSLAPYASLRFRLEEDADRGEGVRSDSSGTFRAVGLFEGDYSVTIAAVGYELVTERVSIGVPTLARTFELQPAAGVEGRVVDERGRPCSDVEVRVRVIDEEGSQPGEISWQGSLRTRTDAGGEYRLRGVPHGRPMALVASDERRGFHEVTTLARGERRRQEIVLAPLETVTVHLTHPTGGGVVGHSVRVQGIDGIDLDVTVKTDDQGTCQVTSLFPGRYLLDATDPLEDRESPSVAARRVEADLRYPGTREFWLEGPRVTSLAGRLRIDDTSPRRARIGFGPRKGTADHYRPLLFDVTDGQFSGHVPPGEYSVTVSIPGRRYRSPRTVHITDCATENLVVAIEKEVGL